MNVSYTVCGRVDTQTSTSVMFQSTSKLGETHTHLVPDMQHFDFSIPPPSFKFEKNAPIEEPGMTRKAKRNLMQNTNPREYRRPMTERRRDYLRKRARERTLRKKALLAQENASNCLPNVSVIRPFGQMPHLNTDVSGEMNHFPLPVQQIQTGEPLMKSVEPTVTALRRSLLAQENVSNHLQNVNVIRPFGQTPHLNTDVSGGMNHFPLAEQQIQTAGTLMKSVQPTVTALRIKGSLAQENASNHLPNVNVIRPFGQMPHLNTDVSGGMNHFPLAEQQIQTGGPLMKSVQPTVTALRRSLLAQENVSNHLPNVNIIRPFGQTPHLNTDVSGRMNHFPLAEQQIQTARPLMKSVQPTVTAFKKCVLPHKNVPYRQRNIHVLRPIKQEPVEETEQKEEVSEEMLKPFPLTLQQTHTGEPLVKSVEPTVPGLIKQVPNIKTEVTEELSEELEHFVHACRQALTRRQVVESVQPTFEQLLTTKNEVKQEPTDVTTDLSEISTSFEPLIGEQSSTVPSISPRIPTFAERMAYKKEKSKKRWILFKAVYSQLERVKRIQSNMLKEQRRMMKDLHTKEIQLCEHQT